MPLFRRKQSAADLEMTVKTLKRALDRGEPMIVVDVRQPEGYRTHPISIPGSVRIPPTDLPDRFGELPRDRPIVLYCT